MKITKYNHACILIEENGKKLLFDPGVFTFSENFQSKNIGAVDAIVLTHAHQDHTAPDNLKAFLSLGPATVIGGPEIVSELTKEGVTVQTIAPGSEQEIAGFTIESFPVTHGPMPVPPAENFAYFINSRLLHPGDSFVTHGLPQPEILALPTQGPWTRLVDVVEFAKTLKPRVALAIHNAAYTPDFGQMMDGYLEQIFRGAGIEFKSLKSGESLEV
jgi:L-ascorbate metabolism protein UlaG (beta-lactamase superfamily)